jgi:hypothetical protein
MPLTAPGKAIGSASASVLKITKAIDNIPSQNVKKRIFPNLPESVEVTGNLDNLKHLDATDTSIAIKTIHRKLDDIEGFMRENAEQMIKILQSIDVTHAEMKSALDKGLKGVEDLIEKKPKLKAYAKLFKTPSAKTLKVAGYGAVLITGTALLANHLYNTANARSGCFKIWTDDAGMRHSCKIQTASCCSEKNSMNVITCVLTSEENTLYSNACKNWSDSKADCCNSFCNKPDNDQSDAVYRCEEKSFTDALIDFTKHTTEYALDAVKDLFTFRFLPILIALAVGCLSFAGVFIILTYLFNVSNMLKYLFSGGVGILGFVAAY